MAARPGRLPAAAPGRRRGTVAARILLLFCFVGAAVEGAVGTEPPLKCDELRLGQYPERGRGRGGRRGLGCYGDGAREGRVRCRCRLAQGLVCLRGGRLPGCLGVRGRGRRRVWGSPSGFTESLREGASRGSQLDGAGEGTA